MFDCLYLLDLNILKSTYNFVSINLFIRGTAWFLHLSEDGSLPVAAITFNHRREALYRAVKEAPTAPAILQTLSTGLKACRMLSASTPVYCIRELVRLHNLAHGGSGVNFFDIVDHALEIEQRWQFHCQERGITAANAWDTYLTSSYMSQS